MKGYHCNSDSFNLGALHIASVCFYLVVCMLCAAYVEYIQAVQCHRPTRETIQPTWQHSLSDHVDSCRLLKTILKLHSLLLILTEALGSPISTRTSLLSLEEEEKRKVEKGGRAVQLSLCLASSFLFSSSHLKLWDTHFSLIAHQCSTHEKVLWICINTAYGSSSTGTRCVQKGRVLPMHYSPFKLPQ